MKKYFKILVAVLVIFLPVLWAKETVIIASEKQYVYDFSEIFSQEEIDELTSGCKEKSKRQQIDFVIVTTNDAEGESAADWSDRFMNENGLGFEEDDHYDKSCVLLLFDFDNSDVYINTTGLGILCIENADIEDILDEIFEYVPQKDFYRASLAFIKKTDKVITANKKSYAQKYIDNWNDFTGTYEEFYKKYVNVSHNAFYGLKSPVRCALIALVVAGITVLIMACGNKSRMTASRFDYMNKRDLKVHVAQDLFIRTTTKRYKISSESSGGHGGSFHSSGGHSHGGGGRHM